MNTPSSPLDRAASIPQLRRLLADDVLQPDEVRHMEKQIRGQLPWKLWLDRGLLSLAVALIVSGIGYFFAHNWTHLTDTDKLGLAGGAVLIAFLGSLYAGADHFVGKLLLLAASLLVGVFIAVFGQIYQTGADTYELFQAWALLILPWVALGRFVPLWLFWIGLLNLTVGFYWPVSLNRPFGIFGVLDSEACFRAETISLFVLNFIALAIREGSSRTVKVPWLDRHWSAWILLAATLTPATCETIFEILQTWNWSTSANPSSVFIHCVLALVLYAALIGGIFAYFFRIHPSLPALSMAVLGACCVLITLAARVFVFNGGPDMAGVLMLMAIVILLIFGGGVFLLREISRHLPSTE